MEHIVERIKVIVKPVYDLIHKMGWSFIKQVALDIGGLLLLVMSLTGTLGIPRGLRIPSMLIGIVALVDVMYLVESSLDSLATGSRSGDDEGMIGSRFLSAGDDPQDKNVKRGNGQGRMYLEPRVPRVSGMGTQNVEIRGEPGKKVIYWPSGGVGLGSSNDVLHIENKSNPIDIRNTALGCGVINLDERGRGVALAERGCANLLYREVTDSGYAGPIGKIHIGGPESSFLEPRGRGEKSRKNGMGGMRTAGGN